MNSNNSYAFEYFFTQIGKSISKYLYDLFTLKEKELEERKNKTHGGKRHEHST